MWKSPGTVRRITMGIKKANRTAAKRVVEVTIYVKSGCCLCEEVLEWFREWKQKFPVRVNEVNIWRDWETFLKFRDKIPVVVVEKEKVFAAPISKNKLQAALKAYIQ